MKLEKDPWLFRAMPWLIGIWFVAAIVAAVIVSTLLAKVGDEISTGGLKAMIERMWCGAGGCK